MSKKTASILFLAVCLLLALLLLTKTITTTVSGFLFAIALVIFGGLSRGIRSKQGSLSLKEKEHSK
ncbi:MAG TPA: hypothetical protein VMF88_15240 [Bacteroidota bacterium]|nr:hypothetical protein [Bacteroidota bacterium]